MVDDKLKESEGEQLLKKFTEGKYNELVDEIEKLTKEYEDSPFAYSLLGNALFNLKNFKDSIKAFEKEIKVSEEEHFLPYYNLGRNYEMLNNSELEISNYLKSFTLNPKKFETNYNLGMAYSRIEDHDNAEKYLTNAHILKKDEPMALINLLALLFKMKKYSLGIEFASQANEEFEKYFQYCYNYALLLYETKKIEESNIMNEKAMVKMLSTEEGIDINPESYEEVKALAQELDLTEEHGYIQQHVDVIKDKITKTDTIINTSDPTKSSYRWLVLFGIWLLYFCFGLSVASLAPLVQVIEADLSIEHALMGTILGAWPLVYIASSLPCGALLDKYGAGNMLLLSAFIVAVAIFLRGFADTYFDLLFTMILFGLAAPLISTGAPKVVSIWYSYIIVRICS